MNEAPKVDDIVAAIDEHAKAREAFNILAGKKPNFPDTAPRELDKGLIASLNHMMISDATKDVTFLLEKTVRNLPEDPYQLNIDKHTEPVVRLAALAPIPNEMLSDIHAMVGYSQRAASFLPDQEETFVLNRMKEVGGYTKSKRFHKTVKEIRNLTQRVHDESGLESDVLVLTPAIFERICKKLPNGPRIAPDELELVVSSKLDPGQALAFSKAALSFGRTPTVKVKTSNSHGDFFRRDLTALIAEEGAANLIFRPDAIQFVQMRTWTDRLRAHIPRRKTLWLSRRP